MIGRSTQKSVERSRERQELRKRANEKWGGRVLMNFRENNKMYWKE